MACHDGWLYTLVVLTILSPALYSALTGFYERVVSGVPPRVGQVHPCVVFVCERPRLTLTMVYGVSLVLTLSAFVSACGDVLPLRVDADLENYIRCDHASSYAFDAVESARLEQESRVCNDDGQGGARRALRARPPLPRAWPTDGADNSTTTRRLDTSAYSIFFLDIIHTAQKRPGNVLTEASIADMRATERKLLDDPDYSRFCLPHAWRGAGADRDCRPHLSAVDSFYDPATGEARLAMA